MQHQNKYRSNIPKFQEDSTKNGIYLSNLSNLANQTAERVREENPEAYDQFQIQQAMRNHPTSETIRYVGADGKIHGMGQVIGLSGNDPVGQFVVEGMILNKPLQWAGKGLLYVLGRSGNKWARSKLISGAIDNMEQIPTISKDNAFSMSKKAWDLAYETALKRKNIELLKKLRELHFWSKSGNDSRVFAHSTNKIFNKFNKKKFGATDEGYNGKGFYFTTTRIPENPKLIKVAKGPSGEIPSMNYGPRKYYVYLKGNREFNVGNPNRNFFNEKNTVGFVNSSNMKGPSEVIVGNPAQIKSARTITYDDKGNFIPLSKRDNFTNLDIRY